MRFLLLLCLAPNFALAINKCSHNLGYHDLCPNPFVSSHSSVPDSDMKISLSKRDNSTCEFYKNGDVIQVGGINVQDEPWGFHRAVNCNYNVKLSLDRDNYMSDHQLVCKKELGMKVIESVYFWHNFSLTSTSFEYDDVIDNYGSSTSDVNCNHKPKYVLFLFLTSRNTKCSLLVQQYRVEGRGCEYQRSPSKVCGAYPCEDAQMILQDLKLIPRRNSGRYYEYQTPPPTPPPSKVVVTQGTTSTTEVPSGSLMDEKPFDWTEMGVRLAFPVVGLVFIFILLCILRERYASDMCRNPNGQAPNNRYHGSVISMDKQGLSF